MCFWYFSMLALEMLTTIAGINLPKAQHAFGEPISIECRNGVSLCLRFLSYVLTLEMLLLVEFDATPHISRCAYKSLPADTKIKLQLYLRIALQ